MVITAEKKKYLASCGAVTVILAALCWHYFLAPWGFYRNLQDDEKKLRMQTVAAAETYLNHQESDGSHRSIVDLYNAHEPLAVDYIVQYDDSWCAVFVSAVAISQNLTDIIPTECGCERQIGLWQDLGQWKEQDSYIPQPGDLIYYDWEDTGTSDCTGWSDHVGMIVGIKWPFMKVIEGNKDDMVAYRILCIGQDTIRGFGLPEYAKKTS